MIFFIFFFKRPRRSVILIAFNHFGMFPSPAPHSRISRLHLAVHTWSSHHDHLNQLSTELTALSTLLRMVERAVYRATVLVRD